MFAVEGLAKLVLHALQFTTTCKPVVDALGGESAASSALLDPCFGPGSALELSIGFPSHARSKARYWGWSVLSPGSCVSTPTEIPRLSKLPRFKQSHFNLAAINSRNTALVSRGPGAGDEHRRRIPGWVNFPRPLHPWSGFKSEVMARKAACDDASLHGCGLSIDLGRLAHAGTGRWTEARVCESGED